jgi:hypothetical protein
MISDSKLKKEIAEIEQENIKNYKRKKYKNI